MSDLSFPSSPSLYDRYTANGKTWYWDGTTWIYGQGPGPADPYFSSVIVLIHGDEFAYDASQLAQVVNRGSSTVATRLQNAGTTLSQAQTKFGTASVRIPNAASTNMVWCPQDANFAFGTGDFTVELWAYPLTLTQCAFFDMRNGNGAYLDINAGPSFASGSVQVFVNSVVQISGTGAITAGAWNHIAAARASGVTRLFVNGVQVGSDWADTTNYLQNGMAWGNNNTNGGIGAGQMNGYVAEMRVTKGVARYTANFTPPTARFPDR